MAPIKIECKENLNYLV